MLLLSLATNSKSDSQENFDKQEKPWLFLKIFQEKNKNFKGICAVLDYSKPKIISIGQPWWPTFFQTLAPLTILVLLQPWFGIEMVKKQLIRKHQQKREWGKLFFSISANWRGIADRYRKIVLKICQYLHLHVKIICWRFHIKTPFSFWDMRTRDMWKICLQTFRKNRIY